MILPRFSRHGLGCGILVAKGSLGVDKEWRKCYHIPKEIMRGKKMTKRIVIGGMLLSLCLFLPFLTGQIPEIGNMLLPMHLPVLLAGFLLGPLYGGVIGMAAPLLRCLLFGRPLFYPTAISMSVELCAYGVLAGVIYFSLLAIWGKNRKNTLSLLNPIYVTLISAMLGGRVAFGIAQAFLLGFGEGGFTLTYFFTEAFANAILGILIQLALIPVLLLALEKAGMTQKGKLK